jgi:hypothetical protein
MAFDFVGDPKNSGFEPVRVTIPEHKLWGDWLPYPERISDRAMYRNGAVISSREEGGRTVWEHWFSVQGRPPLGDQPIRRSMTNHGTYAARAGGYPVIIERRDS